MKNTFALLWLLCLAAPAAADDADSIKQRIARVENGLVARTVAPGEQPRPMRLEQRMAAFKVPGVSIAVINDGRIEWARGYGYADVGARRPVTADTRFQAASIGKALTAMAALALVEQGKLSLDDDVNHQLVSWKVPENAYTAQRKVTLRGLLGHAAGISGHGYMGYGAGAPLPSLLQVLDGAAPANSAPVRVEALPGSAWRYSGGGYSIVQLLLTEAAHADFAALMQRSVLDKLAMSSSSFALPSAWEALATSGYLADGSVIPGKWQRHPELAAAGLWTTPSDLARFAIEIQLSSAGKSNKVLSQAMTKQMLAPGVEGFGLGLFLGEPTDQHDSFRHSGGNVGFRNMMFAYTKTGQGAVVMSNGDNGLELVGEILRAIAREYGWTNYLVETK